MSTTIQDKLNAASAGSTVVLEKGSYDEIVEVPTGKKLTLDLNGSEWTCETGKTPLTVPPGADLTIVNGTISAVNNATVRLGGKDATVRSSLHLGAGMKIVNTDYTGVFISAKGDLVSEADITVSGQGGTCIQGNGSAPYFDNTCRIVGGHLSASGGNGDTMCIYWPQQGDLVIEGGVLEGDGGIEIRAGSLTVTGGQIVATHDSYSVAANGSGTTTNGAAIAVAQHTTKLPIAVKITGGTFTGQVAFSEANPQNNSLADIAKLSATISGGSFVGGVAAVRSADLTNFVYSGEFNQALDNSYVAVGSRMTKDGDTWVFWYPSDGGEATELSSILVDGKVVTTLQGTLIGAVDELPPVTSNGLTKGMVLYSRADKQYHVFDGALWSVEDMDIADDAIDQDHMDSTRPVQTRVVYEFKKETEAALDDRYTKSAVDDKLDKKQDVITGAASSIVSKNLETGRVLISGTDGKVTASSINTATLDHMANLNVDIDEALNAKKDKVEANSEHTALKTGISTLESYTKNELGVRYTKTQVDNELSKKQDMLTAGENITISGTTINAVIPETVVDTVIENSPNPIANKAVYDERTRVNNALADKVEKTYLETNYATKQYVEDAVGGIDLTKVFVYKRSVATYDDLPTGENKVGDTYNVIASFKIGEDTYPPGTNVAWNGESWDPLGGSVDLSVLQAKMVTFSGTVGNWTASEEGGDFAYKGYVGKEGITAADSATVVFSASDASSGNYSPVCETSDGKVWVWAKVQGSPTVTVVVQKG